MSTVLSVISLTAVHSFLVVATPCAVGLDLIGGSKSASILVSTKAVLTLSVLSPIGFLPLGQDSKVPLLFLLVKSTTHTAGIDTHRSIKLWPISVDLSVHPLAS